MISIRVTLDNGETKTLTLEEILKNAGIARAASNSAVLRLEAPTGAMEVTVNYDIDYPGVDIDAEVNGKRYYIANAELPNQENHVITSRLYCGNADQEDDAPAVRMPLGDRNNEDESRRVVFYDGDLVCCIDDSSNGERVVRDWDCEKLYTVTTEDDLWEKIRAEQGAEKEAKS
ncbi:MAG: hypothetical protein LUE86_13245 [Clostridiales bacterium]|nr:hypothetical protein [Clostridiales bacterium]